MEFAAHDAISPAILMHFPSTGFNGLTFNVVYAKLNKFVYHVVVGHRDHGKGGEFTDKEIDLVEGDDSNYTVSPFITASFVESSSTRSISLSLNFPPLAMAMKQRCLIRNIV